MVLAHYFEGLSAISKVVELGLELS